MRTVSELNDSDLRALLTHGQFGLRVGPYAYRVNSRLAVVQQGFRQLYNEFPLVSADAFCDYRIALNPGPGLWPGRRKIRFTLDNQRTFGLFPPEQAYAFLEWGMNWCVSIHANEYLKLHAAVVARDDRLILMPGVPGAGKSTLCAALALSGWRVFSDEHALVIPGSTSVAPVCRPVSLKNESIDIIRHFDSGAVFGPASEDTHKGRVAHMKADLHPESHCSAPLPATAMVFPRYSASEPQALKPQAKSESFVLAAYHAFNYSLLGRTGFETMRSLVDAVDCYHLVYSDLAWAVATLDQLQAGGRAQCAAS